jgi:hypothetical protein
MFMNSMPWSYKAMEIPKASIMQADKRNGKPFEKNQIILLTETRNITETGNESQTDQGRAECVNNYCKRKCI